jgi:signal transduction histidine kinase
LRQNFLERRRRRLRNFRRLGVVALLGLSISYDIIVKQHAGSIDVDTQLGEFTEIRVILPRAAVFV